MSQKKKGMVTGAVITLAGVIAAAFTRGAAIAESATTGNKTCYTIALILALCGVVVLFASCKPAQRKTDAHSLTATAMMAALCFIGFAVFKLDIPVPGSTEKTAFHLGNTFCVLAALLLGGLHGGLAGAVGMTLADVFSGYLTSAPKTFLLKLCIGLITGFVAHRVFKLEKENNPANLTWKVAVSAAAGMLFNVAADPIVGYFYKTYLFGLPQDLAKALAKISAVTTLVNAVVAVIAATVFYLALRPILRRTGLIKNQE